MTIAIPLICGILVIVIIAAIIKKIFFPSSIPIVDMSIITNSDKELNWTPSNHIDRSYICKYPSCSQANEPNIILPCRHIFHMQCMEDWLIVKKG